jgi:hypothetical protein
MPFKVKLIKPATHSYFSVSVVAPTPELAEADVLSMFPKFSVYVVETVPGHCHA